MKKLFFMLTIFVFSTLSNICVYAGWISEKGGASSMYTLEDGTYAKDCWVEDEGKWYYFNSQGYPTYYQWVGNYYLGKGYMLTDSITPDGYLVDSNGAWIPDVKPDLKNGNFAFYTLSMSGAVTNEKFPTRFSMIDLRSSPDMISVKGDFYKYDDETYLGDFIGRFTIYIGDKKDNYDTTKYYKTTESTIFQIQKGPNSPENVDKAYFKEILKLDTAWDTAAILILKVENDEVKEARLQIPE